jgi:hypothetical protein
VDGTKWPPTTCEQTDIWCDRKGEELSVVRYNLAHDCNKDEFWKVENMLSVSPKEESSPKLLPTGSVQCRFFPPIQSEYHCKFSTEEMHPGEVWFVDVEVYKTFAGHQTVYDDYITVVKFLRGDLTGDGVINLGDVVFLITYQYKSGPPPFPLDAGDVNCDGVIALGDLVYLINYQYKNGPAPTCP